MYALGRFVLTRCRVQGSWGLAIGARCSTLFWEGVDPLTRAILNLRVRHSPSYAA
jgi:hypothetical protein